MPAADTLRLQLVRNATVRLGVRSRTLLIDPYLADTNLGISYAGAERSPLVPLPFPIPQVLAGVNAVFISHLHSDHFDETARQVLPRDLPILCPAMLEEALRELGFGDVTGIDESLSWFGTQFHITSGRHGPDAVLAEMGPVNGFVATTPGLPRLYWVGDSIWCSEVRDTIDRFEPEVIVVHACGAGWKPVRSRS